MTEFKKMMPVFDAIKKPLLVAVTIIVLVAGIFTAGYQYAARVYGAQISALKATHALDALNQTIINMHELQAQGRVNDQLTTELANAKNTIAVIKEQLDRSINDAVEKDGPNFNGLGDSGLCIYKRAFGYHCETTN